MKRWLVPVVAVLIMMLTGLPVTADSPEELFEEQLENSGVSSLFDDLPEDTKRMLSKLGIDTLSLETWTKLDVQTAVSSLTDLLSSQAKAPFTAALTTVGVMLLLGFFSSLGMNEGDHAAVFRVVTMLCVMMPLLVPLWQTMERVSAAADSASVFSLSFAPVYAALLSAQGNAATAVSFQTVMLAASETIAFLVRTAIIPLSATAFAMSVGGSLHRELPLGEAGAFVNRAAVWMLGISLTVFVGILSLQTVLSATADSVGGRMMRFSVAGFVPIVGGSLSDALYTVRGCLSALKGSVGGFGILVTCLTVLPPLIECVMWDVLLNVTKTAAQLFSLGECVTVCEAAKRFIKILIAVLASSAVLMIIAVTVASVAGGGAL